MGKKNRSRVLIDSQVQWALVGQSLLFWFLHCLTTVTLLVMIQCLRVGIFRPWSEHWSAIWPLVVSVYLSLFLLLPAFVYDSFKLSQRFAGPVLRLRRFFRDLAAGRPFSPIVFRKRDFWAELGADVNRGLERLMQQQSPSDAGSIGEANETDTAAPLVQARPVASVTLANAAGTAPSVSCETMRG